VGSVRPAIMGRSEEASGMIAQQHDMQFRGGLDDRLPACLRIARPHRRIENRFRCAPGVAGHETVRNFIWVTAGFVHRPVAVYSRRLS